MLFVFLLVLLGVTLWAVWSVYQDLKVRDQAPPTPPAPALPPENVWPPPPRL